MKQKEVERRLRRALQFPRVWFETGLLSGEVLRMQYASLCRHFGNRSRPVRASEHWRHGAFQFILRGAKDEATLVKLLAVAYADPDKPMGGAMVKDILKHPLSGADTESSNKLLKERRAERPRAS
jgi:hypothetical protein